VARETVLIDQLADGALIEARRWGSRHRNRSGLRSGLGLGRWCRRGLRRRGRWPGL